MPPWTKLSVFIKFIGVGGREGEEGGGGVKPVHKHLCIKFCKVLVLVYYLSLLLSKAPFISE